MPTPSFLGALARELIQPFPLLLIICVAPRVDANRVGAADMTGKRRTAGARVASSEGRLSLRG